MGGAKNCPETPRQKMIGMMYLVLTAMLALNVSAEVLAGYDMVFNSLKQSNSNAEVRNKAYFDNIEYLYNQNPEKVKEWWDKAQVVKEKSDKLYNQIQAFKIGLIADADGPEADPTGESIKKADNTSAGGRYAGLTEGEKNGEKLKAAINEYRIFVEEMFGNDTTKNKIYDSRFSTADRYSEKYKMDMSWEVLTFENMPAIAILTMLSKYQNDIRITEAELYQYFTGAQDAGDFRVNSIHARLIPNSKNIIQGDKYKAEIALMAIDSTKKPIYYLGGKKLDSEFIELPCNQVGRTELNGYIEITGQDGETRTYPFSDYYNVSAPAATVANIDMNVVYKGYDNKMEISVPGIADSQLRVSATGATITKSGAQYICKPSASDKITITVSAEVDGKVQSMGQKTFRVRPVPQPTAFLKLQTGDRWNPDTEGIKLKRSDIYSAEVVAEYADGMLNANFTVKSFTLNIQKGQGFDPIKVNGNKLSQEQIESLKKLKIGQLFYINNIEYTGPRSGRLSMSNVKMP